MNQIPFSALLPIITGLLGALVGGIIAEARVSLESLRGRKRVLNRVLRYQLEVLYSLRKVDPQTLTSLTASLVEPRWPGAGSLVATAIAAEPAISTKLLERAEAAINPELIDGYENAINELAEAEPVLAFRLSGIGRLKRVRESQLMATEHFPGDRDLIARAFEPEIFRLAIASIEEDIAKTKPFISRRHRRELNVALQRIKGEAAAEQQEYIEGFWTFLSGVANNLAAAGQVELQNALKYGPMAGPSQPPAV